MRREIPIGGKSGILGFSLIVEDGGSIRRLNTAISVHQKAIRNFLPFFRDLEKELRATERKQFSTEGRHSRKWTALAPEYARIKRRKYGRRKILAATGLLRKALTAVRHPNAMRLKTKDQFVYGTHGIEYARPHQNGYRLHTTDGTSWVPPRRPLDWDDGFQGRVAQLMRRHSNRAARRARLRPVGPGPHIRGQVVPRIK